MRSLLSCVALGLFTGSIACSSSEDAAQPSAGGAGQGGATQSSASTGGGGTGGSGSTTSGGGPSSGLGPATFAPGELDAASNGATITFQNIGAAGWYPSIRDPAAGPCDGYGSDTCCMARETVAGDQLTPWNDELIMTLRGPMDVKQFAVYQPDGGDGAPWRLVSGWDSRSLGLAAGISFTGTAVGGADGAPFAGQIGSECLVNAATNRGFPCGPGSTPFCSESSSAPKTYGWSGSKLFVLLASMPHSGERNAAAPCAMGSTGNWYDAPWIGLSLGELIRAGAFSGCHCYAKDPTQWWLGDGCGQFNVFEVVNDNNSFKNLDVFSTNMFGYAGYVGEGPCGAACDVSQLGPEVDLIDKSTSTEAAQGAVADPDQGPGAAFRRPGVGYRYFLILLDVRSRTVQLGVVHPDEIPAGIAPIVPDLPAEVAPAAIAALLDLRLPR